MSLKTYLAIASLSTLIPIGAIAEPIEDLTLGGHKAGWYPNIFMGKSPNIFMGKSMTCPETCQAQAGGLAEHEASPGVSKRAFVCKVQTGSEGNISTWLYGSQFDDRTACYTVDLSLQGKYSDKYFCLCALK